MGSINALSRTLGLPVSILIEITENAQEFYSPNEPKIKPNGTIRQTFSVKDPLHKLQKKILDAIISGIDFPDYLQGSIKDPVNPRDYIRDASLHSGRDVILKEDISSFFPSTRAEFVFKMWKHLFHFPDDVAKALTKLTTYNDVIPEGAPTSPSIANLVFWNREPALEEKLRQKGYVYSRYVDDITVSFTTRISKEELQNVTTLIYSMFINVGLKPNRRKRSVQTKNKRMSVHNLNVAAGKPTLPKAERAKIRTAVKELELLSQSASSWNELEKVYKKINGRVNLMKRLHPHEAQQYLQRIKTIRDQWKTHQEVK